MNRKIEGTIFIVGSLLIAKFVDAVLKHGFTFSAIVPFRGVLVAIAGIYVLAVAMLVYGLYLVFSVYQPR